MNDGKIKLILDRMARQSVQFRDLSQTNRIWFSDEMGVEFAEGPL